MSRPLVGLSERCALLGANFDSVPISSQAQKEKGPTSCKGLFLLELGRGEKIRTSGPCLPKAVLYQAELHPETGRNHTLRLMCGLAAKSATSGIMMRRLPSLVNSTGWIAGMPRSCRLRAQPSRSSTESRPARDSMVRRVG